jgi:hypothetical protein
MEYTIYIFLPSLLCHDITKRLTDVTLPIMLNCFISVVMKRLSDVGPPAEVTRSTFTGAITGKKVETEEIMPCFSRTSPENLGEMKQNSR